MGIKSQFGNVWNNIAGGGWCPSDDDSGISTYIDNKWAIYDNCDSTQKPGFTSLKYGQAYWVRTKCDCNLVYRDIDEQLVSFPFYEGWNLMSWLGADEEDDDEGWLEWLGFETDMSNMSQQLIIAGSIFALLLMPIYIDKVMKINKVTKIDKVVK